MSERDLNFRKRRVRTKNLFSHLFSPSGIQDRSGRRHLTVKVTESEDDKRDGEIRETDQRTTTEQLENEQTRLNQRTDSSFSIFNVHQRAETDLTDRFHQVHVVHKVSLPQIDSELRAEHNCQNSQSAAGTLLTWQPQTTQAAAFL